MTQPTLLRTPHEIDSELASVLYGEQVHDLSDFFLRRTPTAEIGAALMAETFAKAAQLRMKRGDRAANDHVWLMSIATLELARFFQVGEPSNKSVTSLGMCVLPLQGKIRIQDLNAPTLPEWALN